MIRNSYGNVLELLYIMLLSSITAGAATYYVAPDGLDSNNGSSWLLAKQTIQAAVDIAEDNDLVLVTNGLYNTGSKVTPGYALTNRVCITNVVTLQSVNGPEVTIIEGKNGSNGSNDLDAVRCVYMDNHGTLSGFTLTNGCTMQSGTHLYDASGGGVWCHATSTISNCIITGNDSVHGGGVNFYITGSIADCMIIGNRASDDGGGIQLYGDVTVSNCTFIGNSALSEGGGVYMEGGTMNNCLLSENTALSGGGVLVRSYSLVSDCIISDNSASGGGGGVLFNYGGTLNNSLVRNNSAGFGGGVGIHFYGTINNSVISGNQALTQGGGVYLTYEGYINNCTITENIGTTNGGGALLNYGGQMKNCIVWGNQSPEEAGICLINMSATGILYTCASDGITHGANGCITNDPLFVDAAADNFQIKYASPCRNAGNNIYTPTNITPYDLAGSDRIISSIVDMGAYEVLPVWFESTAGSHGSINGDSSGWYTLGDSVTVTAAPATYYTFGVWSGDVPTGLETNSELTLIMNQARTIAVTFNESVTTNSPTPHWWLAEYGLTDFETDAESDADNDGILSWKEYIAGTVPTNSSSALLTDAGETTLFSYDVARTNEFSEIYTTTVSDVSLVLTWPSAAGRIYSVNYGTEVDSLDTPLATNLPATPNWNTYTCTVYEVSDSTLYFHIGVELEP